MLDSVLAENFHAAYRTKRTGLLVASGIQPPMRFWFEDGSPAALDLGQDKDAALLDVLLEYHRITPGQHVELRQALNDGRTDIAALVVEQGWASAEEVERSTQSLVEDNLCRFFLQHPDTVRFTEGGEPADFDFERRAYRMRIDTEILLRTAKTRNAEVLQLQHEFDAGAAAFTFNSESDASVELAAYEKLVLDYVDGKTPVAAIAAVLRDSDLNVSRVFRSLLDKKVVTRVGLVSSPVGGDGSEAQRASRVQAAIRVQARTIEDFTPYHRSEPEQDRTGSRLLMAGGAVVLLAAAILSWRYQARQAQFRELEDGIVVNVQDRKWSQARMLVDQYRTASDGDFAQLSRADELQRSLNEALVGERLAIGKLIDATDLTEATVRISHLPEGADAEDLRRALARADAALKERIALQSEKITALLDAGRHPTAKTEIDAERSALVRDALNDHVDRWRTRLISQAATETQSLATRRRLAQLVTGSNPSARQQDQLAEVAASIQDREQRIRQRLDQLVAQARQGDPLGAAKVLEQEALGTLVAGSGLQRDLDQAIADIDQLRKPLQAFFDSAVATCTSPAAFTRLERIQSNGRLLLTTLAKGPAEADVRSWTDLLEALKAVSPELPIETQTAQIQGLIQGDRLPAQQEALQERVRQVRALESDAAAEVGVVRSLIRDNHYDAARTRLEQVLAREDFRPTRARIDANELQGQLSQLEAKRKVRRQALDQALLAGDLATAGTISRELGLASLPLTVRSEPSGARVVVEGQDLGVTPLVLDVTGEARDAWAAELHLTGFEPKPIRSSDADGGWRIQAVLERATLATATIGQPVTSQPAVHGDQVAVASRSLLALIDAGTTPGGLQTIPFASAAVDEPVYAPPVPQHDQWLVATRQRVGIRVGGSLSASSTATAERTPLAGGTDLAPVMVVPALVVDRTWTITAGLDGHLRALDPNHSDAGWSGPGGSPFAGAPVALGDRILIARRDGKLEAVSSEDGSTGDPLDLGAPVLAAWPIASGLAGITADERWQWDGASLSRAALPGTAALAADGVVVGTAGRVWTWSGSDWSELGRINGIPSAPPVRWQDQVAVVSGATATVVGTKGFTVTVNAPAEFLAPVIANGRLVLITTDGTVRFYEP